MISLLYSWVHQVFQFLELLLAHGTAWLLLQPCVDAFVMEQVLAAEQTYVLNVLDVWEADDALLLQVSHFVILWELVPFEVDVGLSWDPFVDVKLCPSYVLWFIMLFVFILYISFLINLCHIYSTNYSRNLQIRNLSIFICWQLCLLILPPLSEYFHFPDLSFAIILEVTDTEINS